MLVTISPPIHLAQAPRGMHVGAFTRTRADMKIIRIRTSCVADVCIIRNIIIHIRRRDASVKEVMFVELSCWRIDRLTTHKTSQLIVSRSLSSIKCCSHGYYLTFSLVSQVENIS